MAKDLSSYLMAPEESCVEQLLRDLPWEDEMATRVHSRAADLVGQARGSKRKSKDLESFFQEYGLNTSEGLALMCMAEALLRIPDRKTAAALIRDKVAGTNWLKSASKNKDWMAKAAGLGLTLTSSTINSLFSKLGEPVIQQAMGQAMKVLGKQFVVGETIQKAMKTAQHKENLPYSMSYDMLGEGARTAEDADYYFESYQNALREISAVPPQEGRSSSLSVKLSALHPRYEFAQSDCCLPALTERLLTLSQEAANSNIRLTVDAEESQRLELSLKIIETVLSNPSLQGWDGLGLAVQAYQKRGIHLIDHLADMAGKYHKKLQIRLVKGAYWDSEIKNAQVLGLQDYPVFTRKANTDLSFLACAHKIFAAGDHFYPMFGTHNAHSIAAILDMAGGHKDFEFQKLFGMGNTLYRKVVGEFGVPTSIYAPVGSYEDLLPYLVRRLLENGANSSFVYQIYNDDIDIDLIIEDPVRKSQNYNQKHHPKIPLPSDIYGDRINSAGIDLHDEKTIAGLQSKIARAASKNFECVPLLAGKTEAKGPARDIVNPAFHKDKIGAVRDATSGQIDRGFETAKTGYQIWSGTPWDQRAKVLEKFANLLEENHAELMALCIKEGGKTIEDAHGEVREAVDFCRYYAMRGRIDFYEAGEELPGPTGEENIYTLQPRGVFVCISPWNFPLAIFTGQIVAALMAGNAVIAKPAEQTSLIASKLIQLMIKAGVPREAITLLPGDGRIGAQIVQHSDVAGVAFTGSTEAAQAINRDLAAKNGPIVPLIAETGGQNAMIVDSSALTEQVVDDVVISAFGSAGQRCSACRILFVQDDVADKTIHMLDGAMQQLRLGDPMELSTDIGPVIDENALATLQRHKIQLEGFGKKRGQAPLDDALKNQGHFFAPCAYEINDMSLLQREVFGPILHIIRYSAGHIDSVLQQINDSGYGLTMGVHSRIDGTIRKAIERAAVGNAYVNRSMIGAVVGVQPFGGCGLSGTGPKAGGPHYLHAFATEKVVSTDTTASGGNASLVTLED